jgi:hypothetical protein
MLKRMYVRCRRLKAVGREERAPVIKEAKADRMA